MRILAVPLLILTLALLGACAGRDYDPFSSTPAGLEETTYSEFSDIPIPRRMTPIQMRTSVSMGAGGQKVGVESFSGETNMDVLARVMDDNLRREGWTLKGYVSAVRRYVLLYQRGERYALLHLAPQVSSVDLEVWVMDAMPAGAQLPPMPMLPPEEKSSSFSDTVKSFFAPASSSGTQPQQDPPSDLSTAPLSTAPEPSGAAAVESRELP